MKEKERREALAMLKQGGQILSGITIPLGESERAASALTCFRRVAELIQTEESENEAGSDESQEVMS